MELPEEVKCRDGISTKSGTIVYDGDKEGVSVAVQGTEKKEGNIKEIGVRSLITISNAKAPKEYTFNFSIPKDSKLVYGKDFDKEEFKNGEIVIIDDKGFIISTIKAPWAKDANGKDLKTYYKIKGNTVIQVVDFDENTAFPVVADPWYGRSLKYKKMGKPIEKGFTEYAAEQGRLGFYYDKRGGYMSYSRGNKVSASVTVSVGGGYRAISLATGIGVAYGSKEMGVSRPVPKNKPGWYKLKVTEIKDVQKYKVYRRWKANGKNGSIKWKEYSRTAKIVGHVGIDPKPIRVRIKK